MKIRVKKKNGVKKEPRSIEGLIGAGRRAGLSAGELDSFRKHVIAEGLSIPTASTLMLKMIQKTPVERKIFSTSRTSADGVTIYAEDYGHKAFPMKIKKQ